MPEAAQSNNKNNDRKRKKLPKLQDKTTLDGKRLKHVKEKPPILSEINDLKETQNMFHSNLVRLQIKEMLDELRVKEQLYMFLTNWLLRFQTFLDSLDSTEQKNDFFANCLYTKKLQLPLTQDVVVVGRKHDLNFHFIKPRVKPFFIGSAATNTLVGSKIIADICIMMPATCFHHGDYLNMIYDEKRALYLLYIANQIIEKQFDGIVMEQISFNYYANNPLKPVIHITLPDKINVKRKKLSVRIFVALEESTFTLSRFLPSNNNIQTEILENLSENEKKIITTPTPHYNANVLFDLTLNKNHELLNKTFATNQNLRDGLMLLKVWLRQREMHSGFFGFSAHITAMFICYLYRQNKINNHMSSYQVVRTVWNQLAHSSWSSPLQGITLYVENRDASDNRPTLSQFHEYYEVVFVDVTGYFNICSNLSPEIYKRMRIEANLAVEMLSDMKMNSFQRLFMTKYPLYSQFDHILKIAKPDAIDQVLEMHVPFSDKMDFVGNYFPQLMKTVTSLLEKGLGKRIQAILPIEENSKDWPCTSAPSVKIGRSLQLGLILNPTHAFDIMDKETENNESAKEKFRQFWGSQAKLRRFQDGSISESVIWASSNDTLSKKRLITRNIVLHLLQHHFQLTKRDVIYIAGELDIVYKLLTHDKFKDSKGTDAEILCLRVIRIFDDLARKLHSLKELPLEIVSINGTSAVFRYCEPMPLLPQSRLLGKNIFASRVQHGVLQLASSGKWPNEINAFQAIKTAFYIQIAQQLRKNFKLPAKATYSGVLTIKEGYAFNIEIAHPKELALLKQTKAKGGGTSHSVETCSVSVDLDLEKCHYIIPKVTKALNSLYNQYPCFGGAVMIAKRWLYAQLIDSWLWPDECTELLIATLFLQFRSSSNELTSSPQTAFIRFLQLIVYTDWKSEIFLLNFNNILSQSEVSEFEQRFIKQRNQFPPILIATSYDRGHYGKLWTTDRKPSVNIIARVTILARQALGMIESSITRPQEAFIQPSILFDPSLQGYNLVIQLKADLVPDSTAVNFESPFSASKKTNWNLSLAGIDFLGMAVAKLREAYSEFAEFFYNPCGGKVIGVIWKPDIFVEKEFIMQDFKACHPIKSQKKVELQIESFIEDFKFILKDFYQRIGFVKSGSEALIELSQNKMEAYP